MAAGRDWTVVNMIQLTKDDRSDVMLTLPPLFQAGVAWNNASPAFNTSSSYYLHSSLFSELHLDVANISPLKFGGRGCPPPQHYKNHNHPQSDSLQIPRLASIQKGYPSIQWVSKTTIKWSSNDLQKQKYKSSTKTISQPRQGVQSDVPTKSWGPNLLD